VTTPTVRSLAALACVFILTAGVVARQVEQPSGGGGGGGGGKPPASGQDGRRGPDGPPGQRGPGSPGGRGGEVSIKFAMKGINRAAEKLMTQVLDNAKRDENLRLVNDMQRGVVAAKGQPLETEFLKAAKDDAGKAAIRESYRKHLYDALKMLLEAEALIADGKGEAAKAKLEEVLALSEKAHAELGV
jgi:hypothetical protein